MLKQAQGALASLGGFFQHGDLSLYQDNEITKKLVVLEANQSERNNTQVIRFSETAQATNTETDDSSEQVTGLPELCSFIEKEKIQEVLVESEAMSRDTFVQLAYNLADKDVQLSVIPDQYEVLIGAKITSQGSSFPTIQLATDDKAGWYMNFKRVADVFVSLGILAGMLLLYPIIAALIKLTSKGPVLYKQQRAGLHGRIFNIYKFRSMYQDAEKDTGAVLAKENDHRKTPVGKIMRKIRFDELPNFINVLKGEMSFIGPRPERPELINKLKAEYSFYIGRLQVKPGITGWAQVNGNYEDVKLKLHHDLYYIYFVKNLMSRGFNPTPKVKSLSLHCPFTSFEGRTQCRPLHCVRAQALSKAKESSRIHAKNNAVRRSRPLFLARLRLNAWSHSSFHSPRMPGTGT